jgi:hypothetical protein
MSNKISETLTNVTEEGGRDVNAEKTKCMLMSRHQNAGQNHNIPTVACYQSVQNLLSSRLLSKNVKIKIWKAITLLSVWYGCET